MLGAASPTNREIPRHAALVRLNLQEQVDAGEIHILFESPQELEIDVHFAKIVESVEKYNIQRLVIDGMTSYSTALADLALYRDFFHALVAYSKSRLMSTFFNYENPEFLGVSGVGKTVLGTQLLREGVMRQKQPGLLVSLDEHPAQILRNSGTLGLNLQAQVDAGEIHILFESPQELEIDVHFAKIVDLVEKYNIQRLVIDGMTSYSTALADLALYRDFFHALVAYSKSRLMSTFFNYENPEFLGVSTFMPDFPVSSIVDNSILLSLVEIESSLRRCITVVKARGSAHQFDSREYEIREGGIHLLPISEGAPVRLPLSHYSSVLSRAPTRFNTRLNSLLDSEGAK